MNSTKIIVFFTLALLLFAACGTAEYCNCG